MRPDMLILTSLAVVEMEAHAQVGMITTTSDSDLTILRYQYIVEFRKALIFHR